MLTLSRDYLNSFIFIASSGVNSQELTWLNTLSINAL
nr:MAG TPA: hypothetical protein [Caudoviricetes sp.]